jgi:hypothetical protein
MPRSLSEIGRDIIYDWKKVNYAALPYLSAMRHMSTIDDKYYRDDAKDIILRFLSNASSWRGEKAKSIKKELKEICGV